MRSHARDVIATGPRPFGAVDMELLRKCPCPVLLVRHGDMAQHPHVVGAVNTATEEPSERALNAKIVEWTLLMAGLAGGVSMLLQAWAPFGERMLRDHLSDDAFAEYGDKAGQGAASGLSQLAASFGDRM